MRLVLDTNVIVSGLISPRGSPAALLAAVRRGEARLVTSAEQLAELRDVLERPRLRRYLPLGAAPLFAEMVREIAEVVAGPLPEVTASPDPDDNVILATAVAGGAELIVSGDKRHVLSLGEFQGIPIVTPAEAVQWLGA